MKLRWPRPCLVILLFVAVFFSAAMRMEAEGFLIDSWGTENGLPDSFVTSMVQTRDGYIWVGTYNGLARFDGSHFVVFNSGNTPQLAHSRIVKLYLDADGALWINTYDGSLTVWRNGIFNREWSGSRKGNSEVWLVASDTNEIIFSFRAGLLLRRPAFSAGTNREWQTLSAPVAGPGACYYKDGNGALWCSTLDGKLWRVNHDGFEPLAAQSGLRGKEIHWVTLDPSGHLWVGTEKELARWDGAAFEEMNPSAEPELNVAYLFFMRDGNALVSANGRMREYAKRQWISELKKWPDISQEEELRLSVQQDRSGNLWQITRGMGVVRLSPDGVARQITVADGLPSDHTTCWLEDREGNVWVGMGNGGMARLRPKFFEVLGMPEGQPARPAMSVCEDESGALWVGTYGGGLNCWRDGALKNFGVPNEKNGGFVFSLYPEAGGRLWLSAGMEDVSLFENGNFQNATTNVHGIKSLLIDRKGRTWMGRKDGVACFENGALREWNSHNGWIGRPVRAIVEDRQGDIWLGADDGSLYRFDDGKFQAFKLPKFSATQAVWSLLADADGTLWVGTENAGLLHFENGVFTRFTAKDGLPDDIVCQILDDLQGNLWLGSHQGICRVSKNSLRAFAAGKNSCISCSIYDRSDGLPTLQCSGMYQPAAWRGHDGKLWFTTVKGVVGVQPENVPVNALPPPVAIEEILVDGKAAKVGSQQTEDGSQKSVLRIPPGKQNFEFRYAALSLTDSEKVRFRYRLEGFDSDWINAGTRRWVQYSYLKPGTYHFHVRAANNDGVWNDVGASINIRILPHFWETWWFLTALGLTLLAAVAGAARYISQRELRRELERLAHQRDIEQDRSRIARDIHDHIGSGLTRINLLNELLLGEPAEALPGRVGQITNVTCELMRAMDEIVWAVNPKNDTLDCLMTYLCDYAGEYLRAAKIRFRMNVPAPLPAWHLTSEVRHNLFLAVKEILNNIVKHSHAGEVFFSLKLDADVATLEVRDNGRGFEMDSPQSADSANGNGLDNLQKRALAIGGSCFVRSEPGTGTRIEISILGPKANRMDRN